jgi:hypothetical protein
MNPTLNEIEDAVTALRVAVPGLSWTFDTRNGKRHIFGTAANCIMFAQIAKTDKGWTARVKIDGVSPKTGRLSTRPIRFERKVTGAFAAPVDAGKAAALEIANILTEEAGAVRGGPPPEG